MRSERISRLDTYLSTAPMAEDFLAGATSAREERPADRLLAQQLARERASAARLPALAPGPHHR